MATITQVTSYVQIAAQTAADIVSSKEKWTAFLRTAARIYRYPFVDALLIHAQNPNVTACAEYETYKKMRWYVRRGAKGIALVDVKNGQRPDLRYVFDISNTGRKRNSYNLYLWQYKNNEHQDTVTKALEERYGVSGKEGILVQVAHIAAHTARDYWKNYKREIRCEAEGSLLEGLDDRDLRKRFCDMAAYSVTYAVLYRCGFNPELYNLTSDTFCGIVDFNTQGITKTLGYVVCQSSEEILHLIGIAVTNFERKKQNENRTASQSVTRDEKSKDKKQPSSFVISLDSQKDSASSIKPSLKGLYDKFKPIVKDFLYKDSKYKNACKNSDRENAILEGIAAIKRAALSIKELEFMKLFYDMAEFHDRMQQEVLDESYSALATEPEAEPTVEEPVQDTNTAEELDTAELVQEESIADKPETATEEPEPVIAGTEPEEIITAEPEPATEEPEETVHENPEPDKEPKQPIVLDESAVEEIPPEHAASNYRITDDRLGEGSAKEKYWMNMYAIIMMKQLESENRAATPIEQEILSQYVGWGGIPQVFDSEKANWEKEYKELQSYLTPDEYESARASVLNAHYTSPVVIKAIYESISGMGFKCGNILEPSCGIGNFFGLLPESMRQSKLYGVELDSVTGRIAKFLYPKADIRICGYEKTDFPANFFDLAVGNVPFGQYQVNDLKYNHLKFAIHNYFFAKTLDLVRTGGIIAFISSRYTMDAKNTDVRKYLSERADLLGIIRLPNNAFLANAGTDVVSDIIFLKKREEPAVTEAEWVQTAENSDGFMINRYFIDNPHMVLGKPSAKSTQYGRQDYTVLPIPDADLGQQLQEAVTHIHGKYQETMPADTEKGKAEKTVPADPDVKNKNYSFMLIDSDVYYREDSVMTMQSLNATAKIRVVGMIKLRDCVHELIAMQMCESTPDVAIAKKQAELNMLYDSFTRKYGLINSKANRLAFDKDSFYYLLCSLEILDDDGRLKRKADMFTKRTIQPHKVVTHTDTASEALIVSIGERAKVDLPYMSQLTGKSESELITELRGVIFKDPVSNAWQTADEYLSGNVRRKLRQVQKAAESDPSYQINVEALQKAQPQEIGASEIEARIGSTWINASHIQNFMYDILKTPEFLRNKIKVSFCSYSNWWNISNKTSIPSNDVAAYTTYGTERANAYKILEDSLNLRDVRIYDPVTDPDGKEKRVLNHKQTTLAAQKQTAIREAFKDWIFKDPDRT